MATTESVAGAFAARYGRHSGAVILVHNHPSGDPTPSREDVAMTKEVEAALATVSVVLHDHVIIGNGTWTSLRREGLL